jgi:hypothetical protein
VAAGRLLAILLNGNGAREVEDAALLNQRITA